MRSRTLGAMLVAVLVLGSGAVSSKPAKRGTSHVTHKTPAAQPAAQGSARKERAPSPAAPVETEATSDDDAGDKTTTTTAPAGGGKIKTKAYSFGAMDVEGKLKTPQLLYFLNRVKLELDMSAPDKRSFMKELQQSADDKNL